MDDMSMPDLAIMTKYLDYAETASWIQTRQIMLSVLKPYLKKKDTKAEDLFPLPIDNDIKEIERQNHTTEISNTEVEWFKKFKQNYEKKKGNLLISYPFSVSNNLSIVSKRLSTSLRILVSASIILVLIIRLIPNTAAQKIKDCPKYIRTPVSISWSFKKNDKKHINIPVNNVKIAVIY